MAGGQVSTGGSGQSWTGGGGETGPLVRHRWEANWTEIQDQQFLAPMRRLRRRVITLLLFTAVLAAVFVWCLLFAPIKTPLLAITLTDYAWPQPPNPWAYEDLRGLENQLDGKTIDLIDGSAAWQSKQRGLEDLDRRLRQLVARGRRSEVIILYFSMHGAVDADGTAYLVPSRAEPLSPSTWLSIDGLLDRMERNVPAEINTLLVFDCVRQPTNWDTASLYNTFPRRLAETVSRRGLSNVAAISSTSDGQQAWSSPDLRSSIFGRELRLGLAGAADAPGGKGPWKGGNGDGQVSVRELHAYLAHHVPHWTIANRAAIQAPQLSPENVPDFRVAWSLNSWQISRIRKQQAVVARAADSVPPETLAKLWQRLDRLRTENRFQDAPVAWADIEHQLLRLEVMATSGEAYAEAATQSQRELQRRLDRIVSQAGSESRRIDVFGRAASLSERAAARPPQIRTHSLALSEVFGQVDPADAAALRAKLLSLTNPASRETVDEAMDGFDNGRRFNDFTETNFLRIVRHHDLPRVWPTSDVVQRTITMRDRVERLAVQGDERAHFWVRPWLDRADRQRRVVEDLLFAGPQVDTESPSRNITMALDAIEADHGDMPNKIEAAILLRDRVWAETPYLARWLCSPLFHPHRSAPATTESDAPPGPVGAAGERLVNLQLLPLIRDSHQLGEQIADHSGTPTLEPPVFLDTATHLRQRHAALQDLLERHWLELLKEEPQDAETVREIEAALVIPFVPWDKRLALRQRQATLSTSLLESFATDPDGARSKSLDNAEATNTNAASAATVPYTPYLDRLQTWTTHPLRSILRMDSSTESSRVAAAGEEGAPVSVSVAAPSTVRRLESESGEIRQRLTQLASLDAATLDEWTKSGELDSELPTGRHPRANMALAERLVRSAAPVWFPRPATSPIDRLRRYDLQQRLLWYARRTVDDFYAEGSRAGVGVESPPPFFDLAAADLLQAASTLLEPSEFVAEQIREIDSLRVARRSAVRSLLTISANANPQAGEAESEFLVSLRPARRGSRVAADSTHSVPEGAAAVFLRVDGRALEGARQLAELPLPAEGSQRIVSAVLATGDSLKLQAVTLFRGHEYAVPLLIQDRGGVTVEFVPRRHDTSEVTLWGDRLERSSIVFVLDCSWSMRDPIAIEAIGSDTQPRLSLAKAALIDLLRQLADQRDTRVGVRFFGHRVGWTLPVDPVTGDITGRTRIATQPNYVGDIPDDLAPSEDVELVLPLGRFDARHADIVAAKLQTVEPWGQSPLYRALVESLNDFAADAAGTNKSIVVITDGDDFQFTAGGRARGPTTSMADVQRARRASDVPIYILGFDDSPGEAAPAQAEFIKLANESGGQYHDIHTGAELLRALRGRLSRGGYRVLDPAGQVVRSTPDETISARLNVPVVVHPVAKGKAYGVQFQSLEKVFELWGGESLEMFVTPDGRDIVSKPFDREFPVAGRLIHEREPAAMVGRVHMPLYKNQVATIPISFQNEDSHYTRRPDEIWIEVTPVGDDGERRDHTYIYYDAAFVANKPVPYVNCQAAGWPADAERAAVRMWCKSERTLPLLSIKMSDVSADPAAFGELRKLPGPLGAGYRIEMIDNAEANGTFELRIVEGYEEDSAGVGSLRVQLETPASLLPTRVVRHFDHAGGVVIHTYFFTPEVGHQVARSPLAILNITTRAAAHAGAWHLRGDRPISARLFTAAESLPLDAATGVR